MIKKILAITIMVLFILLIFNINTITGAFGHEKIRLGYCPTMEPRAREYAQNHPNIVLIKQSSTAEALNNLKHEKIDQALVGRLATNNEKGSAHETILRQGYTLVSNQRKIVQKQQLNLFTVHTAVDKIIVEEMLPLSKIIYYNTTEDAIKHGLKEHVLIDWQDFKDNYQLVVVMDNYNKVEQFRIPVLYS
jgi:hypothetical protein